ncbi:IS256 family transposase [Cohnella ginsengisoli]|uniref:Mutator family transposase n=1 Tax=Cohnella ginsengisoli TaxID=425004 RepID=A0A9X4KJ88_9BACL|nr:IS256 family transposase [Cohnella ginsengisoli]MDG0791207.1 IS256 family transposase [Cohnella ginsengisoli]
MAQYQITLDEALLHQLFIGQARDEGVAKLLETVLNQVLKAQATDQLEAEPYERTQTRQGQRNGSYARGLTTRVGKLQLEVPRFRDGQFSTELFARYQRSEQALVTSLMEMVVNGVSTRKVQRITEELCGTTFSKSTVSELCKQLDPLVESWRTRSLEEKSYPFVIVDAMYVKVRENGRVRSRGVLTGYGINEHGNREVLGISIDDTESEASWSAFFEGLKQRGLHGVDLVISDTHGGLVQAIKHHFQGATWQRCQTHFTRNILDVTPKALQSEIKAALRSIFEAQNLESARRLLEETQEMYQEKAPKAMETLERGFDDAAAVLAYPEEYRVRIRTSNGMERVNREIRRRESVIQIFPNRESVIRLIGAVLMELEELWSNKRFMDMTRYHAWQKERAKNQK